MPRPTPVKVIGRAVRMTPDLTRNNQTDIGARSIAFKPTDAAEEPMTYKTLLVHSDADRRATARVEFAAAIAERTGGHLIGLHVQPPFRPPGHIAAEVTATMIDHHRRARAAFEDELRARFTAAAGRAGTLGAEWRSCDGDFVDTVSLHARYADLVIVGQHDPDDPTAHVPAQFPELVTLACGRPVLVVPYAGRFEPRLNRVLIAWNASREAARAVTDALPFLRAAERVTVLVVNAQPSATGHGAEPGADVALWLSRHGVKTEVSADPAVSIDIGAYLLSRAADQSRETKSRMPRVIIGPF